MKEGWGLGAVIVVRAVIVVMSAIAGCFALLHAERNTLFELESEFQYKRCG